MPVIATPVVGPPVDHNQPPAPIGPPCCDTFPFVAEQPSLVSCGNLNVLAVEPSRSFKKPLFGRIRTVRMQAGQQATISWTMQARDGSPVRLTDCVCEPTTSSETSSDGGSETVVTVNGCALKMKFRLREQVALGTCESYVAEFDVAVTDADAGVVQIAIPRESTLYPGIYFGEVAVLGIGDDGEEYVYFSNTFYVAIERGNWSGARTRGLGAPSFAEIRLHLRDSNPNENLLLADLMFDDAEIAMAISRPIQYWNEIPPPVGTYTTQNFPHRYHWLEAIAGELFLMAAEGYRRNHLAYSAAGITIDDNAKSKDYEEASLRRRADWREFVKRKKAEINLNACWGEVTSDYAGGF